MIDLVCWATRNDHNPIQFLEKAVRALMMRTECRVCARLKPGCATAASSLSFWNGASHQDS